MVLVFCPLLTNKTHPAGGIARVVALGSSSWSGGSPWAAPTLAANSSECSRCFACWVRCVSGVPSLVIAFTSSRTFGRIAPLISVPHFSPQPRDFGDHEKAEGPPRGEHRTLPITLSRQAKHSYTGLVRLWVGRSL